jgi:predicted Zn-dependent protease
MMAPNGDATRMIALSSEQEERLRSLGYVGGGAGFGDLDQPGLPDPRTHVRLFERLQVALIAHGPAISRALADAIEIARQDPSSPFAHFTLASLAYRSGQFELADRSFARTLELDPDRPGMRHYYGRLLREMGRAEDSEHQLRIALAQLATDDAATRLNLAETLIALGKLDEAEALIAKVTEQEPRLAEARGAKGRLLLARGKPWEAVPLLEAAAIGLEAEPWIDLARVYLSVGDGTKARQAAAEALSRNQSHPWAIGVLGHALILEGRRAEGIALLRRAVALHPRRPQAWSSLADAFDAAGDASSAAMCRKRSRPMARRAS